MALVRSTAALFLLATFATPALAEIGCAQGCIEALEAEHQSAGLLADYGADQPPLSNPAEKPGVGHCAFGSGACTGILVETSGTVLLQSLPTALVLPHAIHVTVTAREGPERPPRA